MIRVVLALLVVAFAPDVASVLARFALGVLCGLAIAWALTWALTRIMETE